MNMTLPRSPATGLAVSLPPTERRPCSVPYQLRACERPAPPRRPLPEEQPPPERPSPRQAKRLLAALLAMTAGACVGLEPPPRRTP